MNCNLYLGIADLHVKQMEASLLHEVIEMFCLLVHMKNIETSKWKVSEKYKLSVMVLDTVMVLYIVIYDIYLYIICSHICHYCIYYYINLYSNKQDR